MDKRTEKAYKAVFEFINNKVFDLNGTCTFMTDYEIAMRNALKIVYPSATLSACLFHFTQAIHRNASKINGLFRLIRTNELISTIYYKLLYLVHFPISQINLTFNSIKEEAKRINNPELNKFVTYFRRQWILKEGAEKISVFDHDVRTTSAAEGYNRVLNDYCQKKGSFIWFCASIRNQEYMKWREFRSFARSGGLTGYSKKKLINFVMKQFERVHSY